jgi:hypothetical protein
MLWEDIMNLAFLVTGLVLFVYGANYYNALVGWIGVALVAASLLGEIGFKIYVKTTKRSAKLMGVMKNVGPLKIDGLPEVVLEHASHDETQYERWDGILKLPEQYPYNRNAQHYD